MIAPQKKTISDNVAHALHEDIGSGDITASLIPSEQKATAIVVCREQAVICGRPWVDEVFKQLDPEVQVHWKVKEGERVKSNQQILIIQGRARSLLTGERCAMNFLQTLSGTASRSAHYADLVKHFPVKLLDSRKTIPGLRHAQKYAVVTGGCFNHRMGLYDAFLIKENHIIACGGINQSVADARVIAPNKKIEIEVENLKEFKIARDSGVDIIMLDNFSLEMLKKAVMLNQAINNSKPHLEASGGITKDNLLDIAATGVDYISIGALTKDCKTIDLSMRLAETY